MRTFRQPALFALFLLAYCLIATPFLRAQPAPVEPPPVVAEPPAPPTEPEAPKEPAAVTPEAPAAQPEEKTVVPESSASTAEEKPAELKKAEEESDDAEDRGKRWQRHNRHRHHGNENVVFGGDNFLKAGESANEVVSILGSSAAEGTVRGDVVSILGSSTSSVKAGGTVVSVLGSSTSSGQVGDAVVSIMGNTRVENGRVGDASVSVLGHNYVNGEVRGAVVAVLGNLELGPEAVVHGELVCIGGELKRDPKAIVHGEIINFPKGFNFDWLLAWIHECLFKARPLAFGPHLMWAWWIALACLGFYGLLALLFPSGVTKCVETLEERPGYSLLSAVLALLLTPIVYVLLSLTLALVIGIVLLPLFSLGLFFAALLGKAVMLLWIGRRLTRLLGPGTSVHPAMGVLVGGVLVLLLYTIPVVGFLTYKLLGILGLGVVLYTLLRSMQSRRPAPVSSGGVGPGSAAAAAMAGAGTAPLMPETVTLAAPVIPVATPPIISAVTLPRAGFWLRFMASLLDLILVGFVFGVMSSMLGGGGGFPLWLAIYAVAMWATKGTTIGGIICGLKVVRIDDRPLDWSVAIVRGLSAFLSLVVLGLGFIWVAFDDEKQSWHDKIAGTTIVKVPKGTSLL